MIRHKSAVTRSHRRVFLHSDLLHELPHRNRLKNLRPVRRFGGGIAEEDEIGDVDVEIIGEEFDLLTPLPNRHRAEAVEEDDGGFWDGFIGLWAPIGDGSFGVDFNDSPEKTGGGEAAAEIAAVEGDEAEKRRPHLSDLGGVNF